jgi:nucleoside 2-deoxyribosyltransferase
MNRFDRTDICPICAGQLHASFGQAVADLYKVDCSNCGRHRLTYEAAVNLRSLLSIDGAQPRIAHAVHRVKDDEIITAAVLESMQLTSKLPDALERIDNLLLTVGAREQEPGEFVPLNAKHLRASIGCADAGSVQWVLHEAHEEDLIRPGTAGQYTLTLKGRKQLHDLLRRGANSVHAFMAMEFNAEMQELYTKHLKAAVAPTGFDLRTTDHPGKTADLIDNRMRVEIRTARFVVCDLTHSNRGAYWEAGFAEGLGRPVFFICRKDVLQSKDKEIGLHFDAAHQTIIAWDPADPAQAMAELKAMIRATLPAEALMEDS